MADVARVQSQVLANIVERKNPVILVSHNPLFRFRKPLFSDLIVRFTVFFKQMNRVFQNRKYQQLFRLNDGVATKGIEKLLGDHHVGSE